MGPLHMNSLHVNVISSRHFIRAKLNLSNQWKALNKQQLREYMDDTLLMGLPSMHLRFYAWRRRDGDLRVELRPYRASTRIEGKEYVLAPSKTNDR